MRHRTVLSANVTVTLAGVGLYMVMSMIIRYVQTPTTVSYGLGASVLVAGLVLVPMSVMSFASSKFVDLPRPLGPARPAAAPRCARPGRWAGRLRVRSRRSSGRCFVAMGVIGIGVGSVFAVIPRLIVGAVPAEETSSALALTQVLRTIGFSIGSALSATILTAHTPRGRSFPTNGGYTVAARRRRRADDRPTAISWVWVLRADRRR